MINLLLGLGAALAVILLSSLLSIKLWISLPIGILAGAGLFIWQGRKIQQELEKIFTRAGELLKKQQFDKAIEVMHHRDNQFIAKIGAIEMEEVPEDVAAS